MLQHKYRIKSPHLTAHPGHSLWGEVCVSCPKCLGKGGLIQYIKQKSECCPMCEGRGYVELMVEYPLEEV